MSKKHNKSNAQYHINSFVKPMKGLTKSFGRLLLHVNIAQTFTWEHLGKDNRRRTDYMCVRRTQEQNGNTAWSIIIGPLLLMAAWV
jgi:hypothetical protein